MKKVSKNNELDVDFIESKPLSQQEEQALSEAIKKGKVKYFNN